MSSTLTLVPVTVCVSQPVFRNCSLDKKMKGYREPGEGPASRRSEGQAWSQELRAGSGASEAEPRSLGMKL